VSATVASEPFPLGTAEERVARAASASGLCPECRGRLFGRLGHGLSNPERAARLAGAFGPPGPPADPCPLCRGLFDRWDVWIPRASRAVEGIEFHRFACGSRWEPEILAREEALWAEFGATQGESARAAFNREWGKRFAAASGALGEPSDPEIVLLADLPAGRVEVTILPVYVRGRYRKLDRTLPQTRWPCRRCRGLGCESCGGSGKTYPESVEELVAAPFLAATGGESTRFHGMGREDIDARMLGRGRPFVLEIRRPRRRTLDVAALAAEVAAGSVGRVEVLAPANAKAADVVRVKESAPEKSYRVGLRADVPEAKIKEALTLATGRAIAQRTPTRVAHRRSDLVRTRRIVDARLLEASEGRYALELRAEAGTYIKEWVEGDGGRTEPSLAGLLGAPVTVEYLDVVEIHDQEP
jgi:tRNA pseudouridine synthase 10